jgi:S1-C subfamily serine protease
MKMLPVLLLSTFALFGGANVALPQDQASKALTNQDIIDMVSIGISDDVIIEKIHAAPSTQFVTDLEELKVLKTAKVSDAVLKVMISPKPKPADSVGSSRVVDELTTKYKTLQNGVVTVWSELGRGTGFIVSKDGMVITNQHVVGPSEYIAVQFDEKRKVAATLLAADPQHDVAVLRANLTSIPEAIPLEIAKPDELNPPIIEGERVFTIGSPLHQRKVVTSGIVSKIEKTVIISDVNINHGNSGGPLFNSRGQVVGITTFGDVTNQGGPGISGIIKIEEAGPILEAAKAKLAQTTQPKPDFLPVEPESTFPIDALKATLSQEKFDVKPYSFSEGDFDVSIVTPPLSYYLQREAEMGAVKEKGRRNRKSAVAVQDSFRPLDDLRNWEEYLGEYKPVISIRATPKLRETGGSILLRSLAGQYAGPAKLRFKTDFYRMKLFCGDKEIEPITPAKIAHMVSVKNFFVNATDATYEGFYFYSPDAIGPSCSEVKLELYAEKNPNSAVSKTLGEKTVSRVWDDFQPYRAVAASH